MTDFAEMMRDEYEARKEREMKNLTTTVFETKEYRKTATINAVQINEPFSINAKEGILEGKTGDWLAIAHDDTPEAPHRWIISTEDFAKTYELAE